jgi:thiol-disulfide isomerase/thioredoxin
MLEKLVNITIIAVSLVCGVAVVKNTFFRAPPAAVDPQSGGLRGQKVALAGIAKQGVSVVMAVSSHCQYCQRSVPFYQKIGSWQQAGPRFRFVAIGAENQADLAHYLTASNVVVDDVQKIPADIAISRTPTLLLLKDGVVLDAWFGLLDENGEAAVARALQRACPRCKITA